MSFDFMSARHWARELMTRAITPGATAVDATMGNGYDTQFLAEAVGEGGRVYAFDVQAEAVNNTRRRLEEAGLLERVELIHAGHERMAEFVPQNVDAVMFNLGWLPGSDKMIRTDIKTTLPAIEAALQLLREEGLMTVCAYPGHEQGKKELDIILDWAAKLPSDRFDAMVRAFLNQKKDPPVLIAVKKNRR